MKNTDPTLLTEFSFPVPEKVSSNKSYSGIHWTTRVKYKNLYHQYMIQFKDQIVEHYPVLVKYEFRWKTRALDASNCSYMVKLIEDGLVIHGILKSIEQQRKTMS